MTAGRRLCAAVVLAGIGVAGLAACGQRADSGAGAHNSVGAVQGRATTTVPTTSDAGGSSVGGSSVGGPRGTFPHLLPDGNGRAPVFSHGRRDEPLVALTFDSNLTDYMIRELDRGTVRSFANTTVIDVLDRYQVPATMFLSGKWVERYPQVTMRLATDPLFELGSHSYAHVGFAPRCYGLGLLPPSEMAPDVLASFQVLARFTAHPTPYFRFPGGCYTNQALAAVEPTGVTVIEYDLPSGDAFSHSVPAIVQTTLSHVQDGSVVVLHLTGGNTAPLTADALPAIVTGLRARGFELVRVSELIARSQRVPPGGSRAVSQAPQPAVTDHPAAG